MSNAGGMLPSQTDNRKNTFLQAVATLGNIKRAADFTGINSANHYNWMKSDPAYRAAAEIAFEEASDLLENEAYRRGHDGVDKPIFYQGVQCGVIREYSDSLLTLLLKARKPHVFGDKIKQEITGKDGAPLAGYDLSKLPQEKLELMRELLLEAATDESADDSAH